MGSLGLNLMPQVTGWQVCGRNDAFLEQPRTQVTTSTAQLRFPNWDGAKAEDGLQFDVACCRAHCAGGGSSHLELTFCHICGSIRPVYVPLVKQSGSWQTHDNSRASIKGLHLLISRCVSKWRNNPKKHETLIRTR